jgi:hypothetical protein
MTVLQPIVLLMFSERLHSPLTNMEKAVEGYPTEIALTTLPTGH